MDKVELIPADPNSKSHYERLYDQRIACGWGKEDLPGLMETQLKGGKVTYFIVRRHTVDFIAWDMLNMVEGAC